MFIRRTPTFIRIWTYTQIMFCKIRDLRSGLEVPIACNIYLKRCFTKSELVTQFLDKTSWISIKPFRKREN